MSRAPLGHRQWIDEIVIAYLFHLQNQNPKKSYINNLFFFFFLQAHYRTWNEDHFNDRSNIQLFASTFSENFYSDFNFNSSTLLTKRYKTWSYF